VDLFESFQKGFVDLLVSLGEFGGYFVQERADSRDWSGLRTVAVRLT
jgi:hypothetical protein